MARSRKRSARSSSSGSQTTCRFVPFLSKPRCLSISIARLHEIREADTFPCLDLAGARVPEHVHLLSRLRGRHSQTPSSLTFIRRSLFYHRTSSPLSQPTLSSVQRRAQLVLLRSSSSLPRSVRSLRPLPRPYLQPSSRRLRTRRNRCRCRRSPRRTTSDHRIRQVPDASSRSRGEGRVAREEGRRRSSERPQG